MIVLDATIVNVALPSIREDLGFSQTSLAWVVNAYLLTFGGFLLLAGRLGDLYGHRRMFLIGYRALHGRLARMRALHDAGPARHRARDPGLRRRDRRGSRPLADHDALHRAGRPREGDGRLRLRRGRRRHRRRAPRRDPHGPPDLALDLPRQHPGRHRGLRPLRRPPPRLPRPGERGAARRRRRDHGHGRAHACRLRDREREQQRLDVRRDARAAAARRSSSSGSSSRSRRASRPRSCRSASSSTATSRSRT